MVIDALADQRFVYIACGGSSSAAITGNLSCVIQSGFILSGPLFIDLFYISM